MSTGKMHVDEVDTDASLVRRLLAAQFPQWKDLPIEPVRLLSARPPSHDPRLALPPWRHDSRYHPTATMLKTPISQGRGQRHACGGNQDDYEEQRIIGCVPSINRQGVVALQSERDGADHADKQQTEQYRLRSRLVRCQRSTSRPADTGVRRSAP